MIFALIPSTLRRATPLGFAALGGIWSERAGIVNIALEGLMLIGAYGYVVGAHTSGSAWIGLAVGIGFGIGFALIHSVATITFQAEQIVTGVAINILTLGIMEYLVPTSERVVGLPKLKLPIIGTYSILLYFLPILMVVCYFMMFKTIWGLRLQAAGNSTEALKSLSLSREKWQYIGVVLSGILASIGGCFLVSEVNVLTRGIIGGRGYVALAAVIFGKWHPIYTFLACLLFGFADSIELVQEWNLPDQLIKSFPYILTMIVLAGLVGKSSPPAALGK